MGPGARGHAGIAGLNRGYLRPSGADKTTQKGIVSILIDQCERFDAERHGSPSFVRRQVDAICSRLAAGLMTSAE